MRGLDIDSIQQDLFTKGYHIFNDQSLFEYLKDMESYRWLNWKEKEALHLVERDDEMNSIIDNTQRLIGEKYIKLLDPDYQLGGDCEIVNGLDSATLTWHNDEVEGYQLAVLLYWDNLDEDTGGNIEFRYKDTKVITGSFYSKKYQCIMINHGPKFEHIVRPLKLPVNRRMALFNYKSDQVML